MALAVLPEMPSSEILLILSGAIAGGFINGLAGFGTALFALGFFLGVLPPAQAVALVLLLAIATGLQGLWVVRGAMFDNPKRLMRFLLPALVGIPIGVQSLAYVDVPTLKIVVAGFLIIYGGFFTFRRNLPRIDRPTPLVDGVVGFLGGVLGGLASLSGALPTMWCSMRSWPKSETRGVLQPFNLCVLGVSACLLAIRGEYTAQTLYFALIAVPVAIVSAQVGIIAYQRVPDALFQRLLIALCFVSGIVLMIREFS
ncbi:sulfite exporter TauE/SafE family protein [uncultured Roseovarius sp.]|uniref:sulfite exporter TauE/SafE family protein n=1 Tax=uncultured Roseovarius sp. TaxID=293344 RepID=UPI002624EF06|nr:sulfite exporter TauE/SafE family protein [uncultured Roseovarius sp.]